MLPGVVPSLLVPSPDGIRALEGRPRLFLNEAELAGPCRTGIGLGLLVLLGTGDPSPGRRVNPLISSACPVGMLVSAGGDADDRVFSSDRCRAKVGLNQSSSISVKFSLRTDSRSSTFRSTSDRYSTPSLYWRPNMSRLGKSYVCRSTSRSICTGDIASRPISSPMRSRSITFHASRIDEASVLIPSGLHSFRPSFKPVLARRSLRNRR
jgi:hypothetical protein